MKQLFHIRDDHSAGAGKVLVIRLGERHGGFAITDVHASSLDELAFCTTPNWDEESLSQFYEKYPALHGEFENILLAYEYPEVAMIPSSVYRQEATGLLLESLHGNISNTHRISDTIAEKELTTVYGFPRITHDWICRRFPSGKYWHQYSLALKKLSGDYPEGMIRLDFRPEDFTLLAERAGKLLIAETFPYETPDDVLYYLLKITHQFSLSQQHVEVCISGLVDIQSSLFKELYQYFINVTLRDASWRMPTSEFPAHFFTSFNDLALCAS